MMVAADSGFTTIEDMGGAIVCVAKGTTRRETRQRVDRLGLT